MEVSQGPTTVARWLEASIIELLERVPAQQRADAEDYLRGLYRPWMRPPESVSEERTHFGATI